MNRTRVIGLVLAAICVVSASAAAAASAALPELLPANGVFPVKFTSTSGKGTLTNILNEEIICESDANQGEATNAKEDIVNVQFKGCHTKVGIFTVKCQTAGLPEGEIVLEKLTSLLRYAKDEGKLFVVIALERAVGNFAEFECAGVKVVVLGSVIGELTPINVQGTSFKLIFACKELGVQLFKEYEEGEKLVSDFLESKIGEGEEEQACEATEDTLTFAEKVTIDG